MKRYFLSVDWCGRGKRGIFCDGNGNAFSQDEDKPFSEDKIREILGAFEMILNPQSILLSEEELKAYKKWYPLAEYSHQYGYALKQA